MPAPAPRRARADRSARPASPLERALVRERAKRQARIERERERRHARRRFAVLILALLFLTVVLGLTIWDQIQALFGL
jgi:predicted nucleic acid-binding Zn ribbon protein